MSHVTQQLTKGLVPVSVPCCAPQVGEIRRVCIHHGNSMCGATGSCGRGKDGPGANLDGLDTTPLALG